MKRRQQKRKDGQRAAHQNREDNRTVAARGGKATVYIGTKRGRRRTHKQERQRAKRA